MGAVGLNLTVFWEGSGSNEEIQLIPPKVVSAEERNVSEMRERLCVSRARTSQRL